LPKIAVNYRFLHIRAYKTALLLAFSITFDDDKTNVTGKIEV